MQKWPRLGRIFPRQIGRAGEAQLRRHIFENLEMLVRKEEGLAEPGGDERNDGQKSQHAPQNAFRTFVFPEL